MANSPLSAAWRHQEIERGVESDVCQVGQGSRGLRRGPNSAGFGDGREQSRTALGDAQNGRKGIF
jgi:hypothetical protein